MLCPTGKSAMSFDLAAKARINLNGRYVHLGTFPAAAEAHQAYITAKRKNHEGCTI